MVWINGWYDPGKESDAAKALIDQGADIIAQHTDSAAPLQVAEQRGVHGFGQASDMIKFAPKAQLTSSVDHWDDYYTQRIQAAMDGSLEEPGHLGRPVNRGCCTMAPYTNMPDDVAQAGPGGRRRHQERQDRDLQAGRSTTRTASSRWPTAPR